MQKDEDMAETKENWKQTSFWITPGLIIGLAAPAYTALDGVRDDLGAQMRQTEARLDKKIDSLKRTSPGTRTRSTVWKRRWTASWGT